MELPEAFDELKDFATLDTWTAEQWAGLLDKYYASNPCITTIGKPSAKLSQEIEETEKKRIAEQRKELGEEGLKKHQERLDWAKKESDKPIPSEMLTLFPPVNVGLFAFCTNTQPQDLKWIPVETALNNAKGDKSKSDNGEVQKIIEADGAALPYQAHFANVKSNFVTIQVLIDSASLPKELMPYMALFQPSLFNLGVKRADGRVLTHEEVVNQLNEWVNPET